MVYLENPPSYREQAEDFPWEQNYSDRRERVRNEFPVTSIVSRSLRALKRQLYKKRDRLPPLVDDWIKPGTVADVGCGDGATLKWLPEQYRPLGIELSEGLARQSRQLLAHRDATILNMSAIEGLRTIPDGTLSGVIMISFLEHETHPVELLGEVFRVLDQGGGTIIKVPNFASMNRRVLGSRWCGFHFPGHVNYFTPESLREMVESTGFQVVRFGFSDRFFLSDNMWLTALRPD